MIEPKFINKENYSSSSLNYDELLQQGIAFIQQFSGNQWSDYNYHDPGITFLEQICYALTDLGYKANFPIEDILLAHKDKFDLESNNLLIPPEKIFPSAPLTSFDYRKVIIDLEDSVKNAWVYPIKDNALGILGTFDVLIQFKDGLDEAQIESSILNVENILMENRSLGTDFNSIIILKKDIISISGDLTINSFVLGESVLAEIYHKIDLKLNKELKFYEYEDLLQEEKYDQLFSGPIQKNRFIKEEELKRKTNEIYQYEIKEIIQSIEGVIALDNLVIYKNGIKMYDDIIPFDYNSYPSLDKNYYDSNTDRLKFKRNDTSYDIDATILTQLYDSIALNDKKSYFKGYKSKKNIKPGRFSQKQIAHYYSIQNEFPSIYGLKEFELPSKSAPLRKSQVNQLKAYLLLMEQIMANYLSQLVNIRNLFSIDIDINKSSLQTLYNQIPTEIGEIDKLIENKNDSFLKFVNTIAESESVLVKRKNQITDHLLSRFGEIYDTALLSKLNTNIFDDLSEHEIQLESLKSKLNYSKAIVDLGRNRIKAFNYKKEYNLENNISGLRQRLSLVLNIENHEIKSCLDPLVENSEISKIDIEWESELLDIENGPSISVFSSKNSDAEPEDANFYCEDYDTLKSLFLYAHKKKSYQIIKSISDYCLLFNSPKQEAPVKVFNSATEIKCEEIQKKIIEKFKKFNRDCEAFFLIENILLRPNIETNYHLLIYAERNEILLKSYYDTERNVLRDLRDDLWVIILKEQNFSIEKDEKTNEYIIVVYDLFNKPILKSEKQFNTIPLAEAEQARIIKYFSTKRILKSDIISFSSIEVTNREVSKFPNDFPYSNHINFIFPDWPVRFQNNEFKNLIFESIEEFIPAHLSYTTFYLNFQDLEIFEDVYFKWLHYKREGDFAKLELESLQLIQLISSYQPTYVSK
jgi:hypothetical protein